MPDKHKPAGDKPKTEDKPVAEKAVAEARGGTDQYGRRLYDVTCSACGKATQVPFKPSGDRPVYCRNCYIQQRSGGGMNRRPGR